MKRLIASAALLALAACNAPPAADETQAPPLAAPVETEAPAGTYRLDPAHASLVFRVDHIGFSKYTARFTTFDAILELDPANPAATSVTASVDPRSLALDNSPAGFFADMLGETWFNVARHREMTFRSTEIVLTGPDTADIIGEFTLRGITRPLTLAAKFNGGYAGHAYEPNARVGFSAHGALNRSDFGMDYGIPAEGSTMGVSDAVEIIIEVEFMGPPLQQESAP
jgi:polyisoprenoid-binding protein YceI